MDQLRRLRSNKINDGLAVLAGPMTAKLNRVCAMEINTIRPFFLQAQDRYLKLSKVRGAQQCLVATDAQSQIHGNLAWSHAMHGIVRNICLLCVECMSTG